jgi:hypothetical protein
MGIDARIEPPDSTLQGRGAVYDSQGCTKRLLTAPELDGTSCLQFIDPYGDTLFNRLQLPVLRRELESLRLRIKVTPKAADSRRDLSIDEFCSHLGRLVALVDEALVRGPHHFVSD